MKTLFSSHTEGITKDENMLMSPLGQQIQSIWKLEGWGKDHRVCGLEEKKEHAQNGKISDQVSGNVESEPWQSLESASNLKDDKVEILEDKGDLQFDSIKAGEKRKRSHGEKRYAEEHNSKTEKIDRGHEPNENKHLAENIGVATKKTRKKEKKATPLVSKSALGSLPTPQKKRSRKMKTKK